MDEKDFKKHLKDLAHGHHHPEEHDWAGNGAAISKAKRPSGKTKKASRTAKPRKRAGKA
jgi:hypothetical protein